MDFKLVLLIAAGIGLLIYTKKLHFDGVLTQYYPKYINDENWANYNFGGSGY